MANGISINYRREQAGLIAQNLVTWPRPGPPRSQHACLRRSNLGEARKDLSLAGEKLDRAKAETESVQAKLVELQAAAGVEATKSAELSKRLQAKLQEAQTEAGVLRKRIGELEDGLALAIRRERSAGDKAAEISTGRGNYLGGGFTYCVKRPPR